jgi:hypothetical protein
MSKEKIGVSAIVRSQVFPVLVFSRRSLDNIPVKPYNEIILFINSFKQLSKSGIPDIKFNIHEITRFPIDLITIENEQLATAYLRMITNE